MTSCDDYYNNYMINHDGLFTVNDMQYSVVYSCVPLVQNL